MKARIIMHTPEPASGAALYVADLTKALLAAAETVVLFGPRNFAYADELRCAGAELAFSGERSTQPAGFFRPGYPAISPSFWRFASAR